MIPTVAEHPKPASQCASFVESTLSLKTLTSSKMEVRPFFLGDNRIWSFPSVSSLRDYSIWRYFGLAIIAVGAFEFIVPNYFYRLGKMDKRSLDSSS